MVRAGTIGALDQTGIAGLPSGGYAAHLIDCRSYTGFSGSPVYRGRLDARDASLAGMFTAHTATDLLDGDAGAVNRYGVGIMLPVEKIVEAIMGEPFKGIRERNDALVTKERNAPKVVGAARDAPDEFEAFEDLARKIVQVPKSEVDELRDEA